MAVEWQSLLSSNLNRAPHAGSLKSYNNTEPYPANLYPSVQSPGQADNIALKCISADHKLDIKQIDVFDVIAVRSNEIDVHCVYANPTISANGSIIYP